MRTANKHLLWTLLWIFLRYKELKQISKADMKVIIALIRSHRPFPIEYLNTRASTAHVHLLADDLLPTRYNDSCGIEYGRTFVVYVVNIAVRI